MTESEIKTILSDAQSAMSPPTAEGRNALHACIKGHPLSSGTRAADFKNAAFVLSLRCDRTTVDRLYRIAESFE